MGAITHHVHPLSREEVRLLTSPGDWYHAGAGEVPNLQALEIDITIDKVTKHAYPDLPEDKQAYVLAIGVVRLGFEVCFMAPAIVTGSFPADRLRLTFAVRPSTQNDPPWEDAAGWPIAFDWFGSPIGIEELQYEVNRPVLDDALPISRLCDILEAETALLSE